MARWSRLAADTALPVAGAHCPRSRSRAHAARDLHSRRDPIHFARQSQAFEQPDGVARQVELPPP